MVDIKGTTSTSEDVRFKPFEGLSDEDFEILFSSDEPSSLIKHETKISLYQGVFLDNYVDNSWHHPHPLAWDSITYRSTD